MRHDVGTNGTGSWHLLRMFHLCRPQTFVVDVPDMSGRIIFPPTRHSPHPGGACAVDNEVRGGRRQIGARGVRDEVLGTSKLVVRRQLSDYPRAVISWLCGQRSLVHRRVIPSRRGNETLEAHGQTRWWHTRRCTLDALFQQYEAHRLPCGTRQMQRCPIFL